jgi:hypothetical protein
MENITCLKHKPYDNFKVYHPDGTLMFFCSHRKVNWYVKNNLGIFLNDKELKLTFIPGGYGDPISILKGRSNACVVNNSINDLTKHHVVPTQFRKHFKLKYKDKNSFDLCVLNRKIHDEYELHANEFKDILLTDIINIDDIDINISWYTAKTIYNTIIKHFDKIPPSKQVYLQLKFDGLCDKYNFDIDKFKNEFSPYSTNNNKKIIKQVGTENLIVLWKLHFLKYAQPKFLPDWWKPNLLKIINRTTSKNICKTELKEIDMVKNKKLFKLILKYNLDEIASLYI